MDWKALRQRRGVRFVERVGREFMKHDCMSMAAAVAFYTALSFAPLVLLLVTVGSFMGEERQGALIRSFSDQFGPRAGEVTEAVVESANDEPRKIGTLRGMLGVGLLLVSASVVFAQLQSSLNRIWEVKPKAGAGVLQFVRRRLLSLGMVVVGMFILLVSLVLSSVVQNVVATGEGWAARVGMFVASFVVATLLFAAIFKVLPDTSIAWRQVWTGAVLTSVLFSVGKFVLGLYLDKAGVAEGYGEAAGGLIALLVWVYYSCIILFVGAEVTRQRGRRDEDEGTARSGASVALAQG